MIVNFPDEVWGRLASIADNRGVKIADLLVEAVHTVTTGKPPTTPVEVPEPVRGQAGRAQVNTNDPKTVAEIKQLHDLGWSMLETSRRFGVSYDAMRTAYSRLGMTPAKTYNGRIQVDEDELKKLHAEGYSDLDIAAALGVSHHKVRTVRRQLGLPTAGRPGRKPNTQNRSNAA